MEDFAPTTRITGNNARGSKRRIGNSKRSSIDDERTKKKQLNTHHDESNGPKEKKSVLPTLDGTHAFFENQKRGGRGLQRKIKESYNSGAAGADLRVTMDKYTAFLKEKHSLNPTKPFTDSIASNFEHVSHTLLWLMLTGHNVLLYGLGCKRLLLEKLTGTMLGEDVVEVDVTNSFSSTSEDTSFVTMGGGGSLGERGVKGLLNHISKQILKQTELMSYATSLPNQTRILSELLDIHYGRCVPMSSSSYNHSTTGININSSGRINGDAGWMEDGEPNPWHFVVGNGTITGSTGSSRNISSDRKSDDIVSEQEHGGKETGLSGADTYKDTKKSQILKVKQLNMMGTSETSEGRSPAEHYHRNRPSRMVVQDTHRWGGRYAHAQSRLYIVIHDICGAVFGGSRVAQECLAILANCASVVLVSSMEHLNAVASIWDSRLKSEFHWTMVHVPTFRNHHPLPADFPLLASFESLQQHQEMLNQYRNAHQEQQQRQDSSSSSGSRAGERDTAAGDGPQAIDNARRDLHVETADRNAATTKANISLARTASGPGAATASSSTSTTTTTSARTGREPNKKSRDIAASRSSNASVNTNVSVGAGENVSAGASAADPVPRIKTVPPPPPPPPPPPRQLPPPKSTVATRSMDVVLRSLTKTHNEMMDVFCDALRKKRHREEQQQQQLSGSTSSRSTRNRNTSSSLSSKPDRIQYSKGVPFEMLLDALRAKLIVKSGKELKALLKEFMDHNIIVTPYHNECLYVCLKPPYDSVIYGIA